MVAGENASSARSAARTAREPFPAEAAGMADGPGFVTGSLLFPFGRDFRTSPPDERRPHHREQPASVIASLTPNSGSASGDTRVVVRNAAAQVG